MASIAVSSAATLAATRTNAEKFGEVAVRYGLVLLITWMACMKFTGVEASGIEPLVARSPLLGWAYHFLSVQAFSRALGSCELAIALCIALRPVSARVSALGSLGAIGMFLTTLSFLLEPGSWDASLGGFPAPSDPIGEFLLKDVVLLGASAWSFGEAWSNVVSRPAAPGAPRP